MHPIRTVERALLAGSLLLATVTSAQTDVPLSINLFADKDQKISAYPERIIALDKSTLLMLSFKTDLQTSIGTINATYHYLLTPFDRNTLAPGTPKESEPAAAFGKASVEDIFLMKGKPYALVTNQDKVGRKLSLNISPIDPTTLALGTPKEIFSVSDFDLPGGGGAQAQALGLKVGTDAASGGFSITSEPVFLVAGAGAMTQASAYMLCAGLDPDFNLLWKATPNTPLGISNFSYAMVPVGNKAVMIVGGKSGIEGDVSSEVRLFKADAQGIASLESRSMGEEQGPHDVKAVMRADGKIAVAGVYGKLRSSWTMSNRRTDGFYHGVIDPASGSWVVFVTVPMLNAKGKALYDLSILDLESLSDNSTRMLSSAVGSEGLLQDLYLLSFDAAGAVGFNKMVSYGNAINITLPHAYEPNTIVYNDRWYVILNETPENEALRTAGKEAKNSAGKGVPCIMEVKNDGSYAQVFPTASTDPEQAIRPGRMFQVDQNTWATGGGLGYGHSFFGRGLITAK